MSKRSVLIQHYLDEHDLRCAVCHGRQEPWRKISVHHIMGRVGKESDDPRNLILVCEDTCHEGIHRNSVGCSLDLGHVLTAKAEVDGSVDIPFLAGLRGRVGLRDDPKPLPDWALAARIDNQ